MRSRPFIISSIFLAVFLVIFSNQAYATAIGVNRASLEFNDVMRGGYAEDYIVVTTDSAETLGGSLILQGEAGEWLNFSDTEFNFSSNQQYRLKVSINPPMDAKIQEYTVNLSVITSEISRNTQGQMGTSTRASFRIPITIRMTGNERVSCVVGGLQVMDSERGEPTNIKLSIINKGNVRINPEVNIEVFDKFNTKTVGKGNTVFGQTILPTVNAESTQTINIRLDPDQYWAQVSVPLCEYNGLATFDVLEPGGIKDEGDFIRIDAQSWANTGDIIPVNAIFRNKGARGVRASFRGTIINIDTKEIVKVIQTDEYTVAPDETAEIPTFFNPSKGGQYEVRGKIFYNNKLSIERSTLINVNGSDISGAGIKSTTIAIIVIAIIILLLLILIKRRKSRRH